MTAEQIIKAAQDAGFHVSGPRIESPFAEGANIAKQITKFAELVQPAVSTGPVSDLARMVAKVAQHHIGARRPGADEPDDRAYWDMCQRVIDAPTAATAKPLAYVSSDGQSLLFADAVERFELRTRGMQRLYAEPLPGRVAELLNEADYKHNRETNALIRRHSQQLQQLAAQLERLRPALAQITAEAEDYEKRTGCAVSWLATAHAALAEEALQEHTVTGRITSSTPTMQNIPVRTAEAQRIRDALLQKEEQL